MKDYHVHSSFSADSDAPMEEMIRAGIRRGLTDICFTEHVDFKHPDMEFSLNVPSYLAVIDENRRRFAGRIRIHAGVELGVEPNNMEDALAFYREYKNTVEFWLGSCHVFNGHDPYDADFFSQYPAEDVYRDYFAGVEYVADHFPEANSFAHLDYVRRFDPASEKYSLDDHREVLTRILSKIIRSGAALEINTSSLRRGDTDPNPRRDVLRLYHDLGGRAVTLGSDAHEPAHVGLYLPESEALAGELCLRI